MISYIVVGGVCLVVGAAAGLLIGRKNPGVADVAVRVSEKVVK